jgi:hypothetical protein
MVLIRMLGASDTGYTENGKMEEKLVEDAAAKAGKTHSTNVDGVNKKSNGHSNGVTNGHANEKLDRIAKNGIKVQA